MTTYPYNLIDTLIENVTSQEQFNCADRDIIAKDFDKNYKHLYKFLKPDLLDLIIDLYQWHITPEDYAARHNKDLYTVLHERLYMISLLSRQDIFIYFLIGGDMADNIRELRKEYQDLELAYKKRIVKLFNTMKNLTVDNVPTAYNDFINNISINDLALSYADNKTCVDLNIAKVGDITTDTNITTELRDTIQSRIDDYIKRFIDD